MQQQEPDGPWEALCGNKHNNSRSMLMAVRPASFASVWAALLMTQQR